MINNFGSQTGPSILLPDSYIDIPSLSYNIQWEAPKIAKLVQITPITMVYGTYNELVAGANLNQQTSLGGGHIVPYHYACLYIIHWCSSIRWIPLDEQSEPLRVYAID